jgi:hypothetical protein
LALRGKIKSGFLFPSIKNEAVERNGGYGEKGGRRKDETWKGKSRVERRGLAGRLLDCWTVRLEKKGNLAESKARADWEMGDKSEIGSTNQSFGSNRRGFPGGLGPSHFFEDFFLLGGSKPERMGGPSMWAQVRESLFYISKFAS